MINKVTITNYIGESLVMDLRSPEQSGFFIRKIHGLGPSKAIVNTTEVLSADGAFFNSSRISSRNIVIDLGFLDDGRSIETTRQQTYRFFPMKKLITIQIETDNRNGITYGYVESNEPNIFSKEEGAIISIICPSAFFYSNDDIFTIFSGTNPSFEFPFENSSLVSSLIELGQVFIDTQKSIFYTGDEETGVIISINVLGDVNNLAIHNATRSQTMEISSAVIISMTGEDLKLGDNVIISTIRGDKYIYLIRNGTVYNILNALSETAIWFRLERGDNVFTYTADNGLSNLQFSITNKVVYGGL